MKISSEWRFGVVFKQYTCSLPQQFNCKSLHSSKSTVDWGVVLRGSQESIVVENPMNYVLLPRTLRATQSEKPELGWFDFWNCPLLFETSPGHSASQKAKGKNELHFLPLLSHKWLNKPAENWLCVSGLYPGNLGWIHREGICLEVALKKVGYLPKKAQTLHAKGFWKLAHLSRREVITKNHEINHLI